MSSNNTWLLLIASYILGPSDFLFQNLPISVSHFSEFCFRAEITSFYRFQRGFSCFCPIFIKLHWLANFRSIKYHHLANWSWNSPWKSTTVAVSRSDNKQNCCGTGEECECEELCLRKSSPLACRVMLFATSSLKYTSSEIFYHLAIATWSLTRVYTVRVFWFLYIVVHSVKNGIIRRNF